MHAVCRCVVLNLDDGSRSTVNTHVLIDGADDEQMGSLQAHKRALRAVFLWTTAHRLVSLALLVIFSVFQTPFDTSSRLLLDLDGHNFPARTQGIWSLAGPLLRWDTTHFLGIASPRSLPPSEPRATAFAGLSAEHHFAFQSGIVTLLRFCGGLLSSSWAPRQALLVTAVVSTLTSLLSPSLLYV